jgi:hypothetical protein
MCSSMCTLDWVPQVPQPEPSPSAYASDSATDFKGVDTIMTHEEEGSQVRTEKYFPTGRSCVPPPPPHLAPEFSSGEKREPIGGIKPWLSGSSYLLFPPSSHHCASLLVRRCRRSGGGIRTSCWVHHRLLLVHLPFSPFPLPHSPTAERW